MMWNEGYTSEIGYTYGCYRELSPVYQKFVLNLAAFEDIQPSTMNCLELGFGQGVSTLIHSAVTGHQYWANDFNPAQVAPAQAIAARADLSCILTDQSFDELARDPDLPNFDNVGMHGIWSWVSEENHQSILNILRKNVRPGGNVYISYNVSPGWSPMVPIRGLMHQFVERATAETDGLANRIGESIDLIKKMVELDAAYFSQNKGLSARVEKLFEYAPDYLAHEYFNRNWQCVPFNEMAQTMGKVKLDWATSANVIEQTPALSLSPEQLEYFNTISDAVLSQTIYDVLINQQFRRDIFSRGGNRVNLARRRAMLNEHAFILVKNPKDITFEHMTSNGTVNLNKEIYQPLVDYFSDNQDRPISMESVVKAPGLAGLTVDQVHQAVAVMVGVGSLNPTQPVEKIEEVASAANRLNRVFCSLAATGTNYQYLGSPVVGTGVMVSRFDQLFCMALLEGAKTDDDVSDSVWRVLHKNDEKLLQEGTPIIEPEENKAKLKELYKEFALERKQQINSMQFFDKKI